MRAKVSSLVFVLLLVAGSAWANNLTAGTAYSIKPGGTASEGFLDGTNTARWYKFTAVSGRSYCVETTGGVHFDTSAASDIDTAINVFRSDAATTIGSDDDDAQEPFGFFTSRVCYVAPFTDTEFIQVTQSSFAPGASMSFRVRIVETTLFSNWFFLGGDYSAYTLLRNTTINSVNYTINWRNAAGAIVAIQSGTLASNASTYVDARTKGGALAAVSGTVEIVHNGSPDAIMATTTVLSATTGLSFDTFFTKRASW